MPHHAVLRCSVGCMFLLLCLLLGGISCTAQASPLPVQREMFVDHHGQMSFEQVQQQAFAPAPEFLSRGYTKSALWLRVTVPPSTEPRLVVSVRPSHIDQLHLYRPAAPSAPTDAPWEIRQGGDLLAYQQRERPDLTYSFWLYPAAPQQATVFYVRLQSNTVQALNVQVRTEADAQHFESLQYLLVGAYICLLLVLAWIALMRALISKDGAWLINGLLQLAGIVLTLAFTGFLARYILPAQPYWVDRASMLAACVHLTLASLMYAKINAIFDGNRLIFWLRTAVVLILCWEVWQIFGGDPRLAMKLNTNAVLFYTLIGLADLLLFNINDRPLRWTIRVFYGLQISYLIYLLLPMLGVGQSGALHVLPSTLLVNLFAAVMLHLVLMRRDVLQQREYALLHGQIQETQRRFQWEQQKLQESATFINMLLHELKSPLASIRLSALTLQRKLEDTFGRQRLVRIQQAIDSMDAVLERCRQVDRLEQGHTSEHPETLDLVALLHDYQHQHKNAHRLVLQLPSNLPVQADSLNVKTMFSNLLDNALAYSPPDSLVEVQLLSSETPPRWHLVVRNLPGRAGYPDAQQIFQKYYRANAAHHATGSGLGLYLVQQIAQRGGGQVQYRQDGMWITFTLEYPRC